MVLQLIAEKNMYHLVEIAAGGDGGDGASIIFEVDEGLRTLLDFRYQTHFKAKRGDGGQSSNMHGKNAEHLVLKVPPGTIIKSADSEEVLADLVENGQRAVVAKGDVEDAETLDLRHQETLRLILVKTENLARKLK